MPRAEPSIDRGRDRVVLLLPIELGRKIREKARDEHRTLQGQCLRMFEKYFKSEEASGQ